MNYKERLKQYVKEDKIYNDWLDENTSYISDFDRFCIEHCKDIEELLKQNKRSEQALDEIEKYIEEHKVKHYKLIDRPDGIDIILLENEIDDLLKIIQKAKGDVKNENNNI